MLKRFFIFSFILIYTCLSLNLEVYAGTKDSYVDSLDYIFDSEKLKEIYSKQLSKLQLNIDDLGLTSEELKFLEILRNEKYFYINYQNNDIGVIDGRNFNMEALIIDEINRVLNTDIEIINTKDVNLTSMVEVTKIVEQNNNFFSTIFNYGDLKNLPIDFLHSAVYSNKNFFVISSDMTNIEDIDEILSVEGSYKNLAVSSTIDDVIGIYNKNIENYKILTPETARKMLKSKEIDYYICELNAATIVTENSSLQFKAFETNYSTVDNSVNMFFANNNNRVFIQILDKIIALLDKSVLRQYYYVYSHYQISELFKASLTMEEKTLLASLPDLNVGVYDLKSLTEIKGKKLYGYTADVLTILNGLLDVDFNYIDISSENYVKLFTEGRLDILPYSLKESAIDTLYDFKDINIEMGMTDHYIDRKFEVLKHIDTDDLTDLKKLSYVDVGTLDHLLQPVRYFLSDTIGKENIPMKTYHSMDELVQALNTGEIKYALVTPGTSAYYEREFSLEQKIILAYDVSENISEKNYKWVMLVHLSENTDTLVRIINKALQVIDFNQLSSNWFDYSLNYESYKQLKKNSETTTISILVAGLTGISVIILLVSRNVKSTRVMRQIANVDNLTNLLNKDALFENMKNKSNFFIILINVRGFKSLNEVYGIIIADELLITIANKLKKIEATSAYSIVPYRLEKDEFLLCVNNTTNFKEAEFLEDFTHSLKESIKIKNLTFNLEYSVSGIASSYTNGDFRQALISANNMLVKNRSSNKPFIIYDEIEKQAILEYLDIEKSLYNVTERNILPYFQPFIDVKTGKVKGCEVLARLSMNGQVYLPYKFIPVAEKNGLLDDIDRLMLRRTLAIREQMLREGIIDKEFYFSLNISAQFLKELSIEYLDRIMIEFKLQDYSFLQMEVLEEKLSDEEARKIFEIVSAKNILSAIDDFSTGYSSLLRLVKHFKFKVLKIDKSLLPINFTEKDKSVYKAIVDVVKKLDMSIVCEGVETEEHTVFLSTIDVDTFQGYFFSKPIPLEEFKQYIVISNKKNNS